jgi:hypothetical protein
MPPIVSSIVSAHVEALGAPSVGSSSRCRTVEAGRTL